MCGEQIERHGLVPVHTYRGSGARWWVTTRQRRRLRTNRHGRVYGSGPSGMPENSPGAQGRAGPGARRRRRLQQAGWIPRALSWNTVTPWTRVQSTGLATRTGDHGNGLTDALRAGAARQSVHHPSSKVPT